jgi:hypothetical protein
VALRDWRFLTGDLELLESELDTRSRLIRLEVIERFGCLFTGIMIRFSDADNHVFLSLGTPDLIAPKWRQS